MRAKEYEAIVEDCRASGMTIREYSEKIGVSVETLHTWIRRTRKKRGIEDDRKSYEEYRAIVLECKKSGQLAKDWCAAHGIRYTIYCEWAKKVNKKEGRAKIDGMCGIQRSPRGRQSAKPSGFFDPLKFISALFLRQRSALKMRKAKTAFKENQKNFKKRPFWGEICFWNMLYCWR